MKEVSIVSFKLKKCIDSQKTAIQRALKGYIDHSNKGSHIYKRKGILENTPHLTLNKGVILIDTKNKIKLTKILANTIISMRTNSNPFIESLLL